MSNPSDPNWNPSEEQVGSFQDWLRSGDSVLLPGGVITEPDVITDPADAGSVPDADTDTGTGSEAPLPEWSLLDVLINPWRYAFGDPTQPPPTAVGSIFRDTAGAAASGFGQTFGSVAGIALLVGVGYLIFINEQGRALR